VRGCDAADIVPTQTPLSISLIVRDIKRYDAGT
jgi:hypothetical protein